MDKKQLALTVILFFFGIIMTTQYRSHVSSYSDLSNQDQEVLATMARELTTRKRLVDSEINALEKRIDQITSSDNAARTSLENLNRDLETLRKINGTSTLKGPGIILRIDETSPVVYTDLVKLINEMWNSGAEAISLNEVRITGHTDLYQSDTTYQMTINAQILEAPYELKVLGNPSVLKTGLELPGGILDTLTLYGVAFTIDTIPELVIPEAQGRTAFGYAKEIR